MPHFRERHAAARVQKLASFWPIVGVTGLRQVGKTTFLEKHFQFQSNSSLDNDATRADAENSAVSFVSKLETPALVDEVQKAPKLFDAFKLLVHKNKKPGQYFITGSTSFSEGAGVRESLTDRIGSCQLFPMTVSEACQLDMPPILKAQVKDGFKPRVSLEDFSRSMVRGGMPVPMFARDASQVELYWEGWLATSVLRDLSRLLGKGFEADFAFSLLGQIGKALREGEMPTTAHLQSKSSRKLNRYLSAFENLFLLRKIPCHELGVGKDLWLPTDSGLAAHLMKEKTTEGASISLARLTILNELFALHEYAGQSFFLRYFKSAQGSPVDFVLDNVPFRIVPMSDLSKGPWGWYEKPVLGAMKKLGSKTGVLLAPVDRVHSDKKSGISIYPWTVWS